VAEDVPPIDRANQRILEALQQDGRLSNVELAQRIGLSESPCFRRVRALEASGLVAGYAARLDQRRLGLPVTAYVHVSIDQHDDQLRRDFVRRVEAEPHVIECHAMTGSSDFLLKVVARSIDHFSELSMRGILKWPGVRNMESQFSLQTIKSGSPLPVARTDA
jgi:Lrp/AsnC family transcriptional regulator, leucine-responsive regulatory protein